MASGGNLAEHNHRTRMRKYGVRSYGNLDGLGEQERRSGVKGIMRPGSWSYPRAPFDRAAEQAAKQGRREAA